MSQLLSLGAINKVTYNYVYPKIANKKDKYKCPDCNKDVILCQGEIRAHYFRHKTDSINPCYRYSNPTETQIHKDAKSLLKNILERKNQISFIRNCCCCKKEEEYEIPEITETSEIYLEYRFDFNGQKQADVVYLDNKEILCLFEICNTHKTSSENRPEPWFEINAETLIKIVNDNYLSSIQIPCIRLEKCDECIEKEKKIKEKENTLYNYKRIEYYYFKNRYKSDIIQIPYNYRGNIEYYPKLISDYINKYIDTYEKQQNKVLYKNEEYYNTYKKAILNIYKYNGISSYTLDNWNKRTITNVNIQEINKLLKKDNLKNPITLFKEIMEIFSNINNCEKCKNNYYCMCCLTESEKQLLSNKTCLICKGTKQILKGIYINDCYYCKEK